MSLIPTTLLFKKSVFGTVMSMMCWSLESKIDWSPLRSVEYLPEISTWCQYFIQICSFLLLVVRVEKYLPLQPCSTEKHCQSQRAYWGSVRERWNKREVDTLGKRNQFLRSMSQIWASNIRKAHAACFKKTTSEDISSAFRDVAMKLDVEQHKR